MSLTVAMARVIPINLQVTKPHHVSETRCRVPYRCCSTNHAEIIVVFRQQIVYVLDLQMPQTSAGSHFEALRAYLRSEKMLTRWSNKRCSLRTRVDDDLIIRLDTVISEELRGPVHREYGRAE